MRTKKNIIVLIIMAIFFTFMIPGLTYAQFDDSDPFPFEKLMEGLQQKRERLKIEKERIEGEISRLEASPLDPAKKMELQQLLQELDKINKELAYIRRTLHNIN